MLTMESLEPTPSRTIATSQGRIEESHLESGQQWAECGDNSILFLKSELDETKALLVSQEQKSSSLSDKIDALKAIAEESRRRYEALLASKEESICGLEFDLDESKSLVASKDRLIRRLESELNESKSLLRTETEKSASWNKTVVDALRASAGEPRLRYEALLASKEETIRRLESDLNKCKSHLCTATEKALSVSQAIDILRGQIEENNKKSDDIVGLMNSQLEEVKEVNQRTCNKAFLNLDELTKAVDMYLSGDIQQMSSVMYVYGAISRWDVSRVSSFSCLFDVGRNPKASTFNEDLSSWDVSSGSNFTRMFREASKFNCDLSAWNMSSAMKTAGMFQGSKSFESDLSKWDVSNVTDMRLMFYEAVSFRSDIRNWDISKATHMSRMFGPSLERFRGQISGWDLSKVNDCENMFETPRRRQRT